MINLIIYIICCAGISTLTGIPILELIICIPIIIFVICFIWALIQESDIHFLN